MAPLYKCVNRNSTVCQQKYLIHFNLCSEYIGSSVVVVVVRVAVLFSSSLLLSLVKDERLKSRVGINKSFKLQLTQSLNFRKM